MNQTSLSLRVWAFLWAIFGLALSLLFVLVDWVPITNSKWFVFVILLSMATLTQFMEARFGKQTYSPHLVPFFAGLLLLPPSLYIGLIVIPHLIEWGEKRLKKSKYLKVWYIQPYNIATHLIAGLSAQTLLVTLKPIEVVAGIPVDFLAALAAITLYIVINHYLVGQVLLLARGIPWAESKMWSLEVLSPDIAMLAVGYIFAVLWNFSPWLTIPVLAPLGLMFQAMKVPQLQQDARMDEKTGLLNSRHFKERFEEELLLAKRFNRPIAIIMADLDLLRNVNNNYGHLAGDIVIAGIATIIRHETRDYDIAARFGGEEYAIVLPNTTDDIARKVAERLRRTVEETVFYAPNTGSEIHVTISMGIAVMPENGSDMASLIHEADVALYQAKYRGRNQAISAQDVPHSFRLEHQKKTALDPDQKAAQQADSDSAAQVEGIPTHHEPTSGKRTLAAKEDSTAHPAVFAASADSQPQTAQANPLFSPPTDLSAGAAEKNQASHPLFIPYMIVIVLGGLITTGWSLWSAESLPFGTLFIFAILAVLAESLNVRMYMKSSVSASATVTLAALLLVGLPGVVATSSAITIAHFIRQRPLLYRAAFNWSIHILAGIIPVLIFSFFPYPQNPTYALQWGVLCVAAIVPYFLVETGLIAAAIGLKGQESIIAVWHEHFSWLVLQYIVMGMLSAFIGLAYITLGLWGLIGFVLPVYLIQQTQKMYVERTENSVAELHRMNGELQTANQEVARASQEIHNLNMELLDLLAKIIDARDPETSGHAINVGEFAVAIGRQFNFGQQRLENLRWAGMLHDIGKLGVPEKVLHKPAALTAEEYAQVKKHAELGGALLETVHGLSHLAPFVRHHHERWDGTGYPAELSGEEIPMEARILAVCDAVEAMAATRPYKQQYSTEEIINELRRCAGGQFDPAVVKAFIKELPTKTIENTQRRNKAETEKIRLTVTEISSHLTGTPIPPPAFQPSA